MSRTSMLQCCAAVCLFASLTLNANAQEGASPFEGIEGVAPADEAKAADPAAAAVEALGGDKSVLAGDHEHDHADDHQHGHEMGGADFCRCVGESDSAAIARIEKALQEPLRSNGLDFTDTPLEEVVNAIQEEYGFPIQIDHHALEAIGSEPSEPVTINVHNVSLRSALRLMLKGLNLT